VGALLRAQRPAYVTSAIDAVNVALPAYQSEDEAKKAEHAKAQAHYRAQVTGLEEQRAGTPSESPRSSAVAAILAEQRAEAKKAQQTKAEARYRAYRAWVSDLEEQREARHAATHDRDGEGRS